MVLLAPKGCAAQSVWSMQAPCFLPVLFHSFFLSLIVIQADAKTLRFKDKVLKKGGLWRDIYGIDEKKVASLVREDKVDILVELTGHTANNKLGTLACRPAPIQVLGAT